MNLRLQSLDDLMKEMEDLATFIVTLDTNNITIKQRFILQKEVIQLQAKSANLAYNYMNLRLRITSEDRSLNDVLERLNSIEAEAFQNSLKHIKLKESVVKERGDQFQEKMDAFGRFIGKPN